MRILGLGATLLVMAMAAPAMAQTADVKVARTAAASATSGTDFAYSLTITNDGPATATGVTLQETISEFVTLLAYSMPVGFTCSHAFSGERRVINCTNPAMAPGENATVDVTIRLPALSSGTYAFQAKALSDASPSDPDTFNNYNNMNLLVYHAATPTVPTLTEWAMILFAALLAGAAALTLHRRRHA